MIGRVRELVGKMVIQFEENPNSFILYGCKIDSRAYNSSWVCGISKLSDTLRVGDLIEVKEGHGEKVQLPGQIDLPSAQSGSPDNRLNEIINLLKDIKGLLSTTNKQGVSVKTTKKKQFDISSYEAVKEGYTVNGTRREMVYKKPGATVTSDGIFSDGEVAYNIEGEYYDRHSMLCWLSINGVSTSKEREEIREIEKRWKEEGVEYGREYDRGWKLQVSTEGSGSGEGPTDLGVSGVIETREEEGRVDAVPAV